MEVAVVNVQGEKIRTVELPADIFEASINVDLMHQAFIRQLANARLGTHDTKTRSEVAGGGRKPWKQKGTGRARQGSTRSAQWVGGGRIHTPHPRDHSVRMPQKMRQAALRSALSVKAAENDIVVLDQLNIAEGKTQLMSQVLNKLVGNATVLIVIPHKDENYEKVTRSASNLPDTKALLANYLNIRDLIGYDKLILPLESLDILTNFLGS